MAERTDEVRGLVVGDPRQSPALSTGLSDFGRGTPTSLQQSQSQEHSQRSSVTEDTSTEDKDLPKNHREVLVAIRHRILSGSSASPLIDQLVSVAGKDVKRVVQSLLQDLLSLITHGSSVETSSKKIIKASEALLRQGKPFGVLDNEQTVAVLHTLRAIVERTGVFDSRSALARHMIGMLRSPNIPAQLRDAILATATSLTKSHQGFAEAVVKELLETPEPRSALTAVALQVHQMALFDQLSHALSYDPIASCQATSTLLAHGLLVDVDAAKPFFLLLLGQLRHVHDGASIVACCGTVGSCLTHFWNAFYEQRDIRLGVMSSIAALAERVQLTFEESKGLGRQSSARSPRSLARSPSNGVLHPPPQRSVSSASLAAMATNGTSTAHSPTLSEREGLESPPMPRSKAAALRRSRSGSLPFLRAATRSPALIEEPTSGSTRRANQSATTRSSRSPSQFRRVKSNVDDTSIKLLSTAEIDAIDDACRRLFRLVYCYFPHDSVSLIERAETYQVEADLLRSYMLRVSHTLPTHPFLFLGVEYHRSQWKSKSPFDRAAEANSLLDIAEQSHGLPSTPGSRASPSSAASVPTDAGASVSLTDERRQNISPAASSGISTLRLKRQIEELRQELTAARAKHLRQQELSTSISPRQTKSRSGSNSSQLPSHVDHSLDVVAAKTELAAARVENTFLRESLRETRLEVSALQETAHIFDSPQEPWEEAMKAFDVHEAERRQWQKDRSVILEELERMKVKTRQLEKQVAEGCHHHDIADVADLRQELEAARAKNIVLSQEIEHLKSLEARQSALEQHATKLTAAAVRLQQQQPTPVAIRRVTDRYKEQQHMLDKQLAALSQKEVELEDRLQEANIIREQRDARILDLEEALRHSDEKLSKTKKLLADAQLQHEEQMRVLTRQCESLRATNHKLEDKIIHLLLALEERQWSQQET